MTDIEGVAAEEERLASNDFDRNREQFLATLVGKLTSVLQEYVGLEESKGFLTMVGTDVGSQWNTEYRDALDKPKMSREQIAAAMVDLKRRIGGDFKVVDITEEKIVLRNSRCPFHEHAKGRQALCQMTSSVFGRICADNTGYAKVFLPQTIARGDNQCEVIIHLNEDDPEMYDYTINGDEYFGVDR